MICQIHMQQKMLTLETDSADTLPFHAKGRGKHEPQINSKPWFNHDLVLYLNLPATGMNIKELLHMADL